MKMSGHEHIFCSEAQFSRMYRGLENTRISKKMEDSTGDVQTESGVGDRIKNAFLREATETVVNSHPY